MLRLAALAQQAIAGDPAAVDELLRELRPEIVRTVRLIVGSGSWAAEDAAQDALLDVMRGLGRLREPAAVRGWAIQVAVTRALKVSRRERRLMSLRVQADAYESPAPPADTRAAALKSAFDTLPPRMRAAAVLRLYTGLSEQETASVLGCTVGTMKSQLHDARERLAEALRAEGVVPQTASPAQDALL